VISMVIVLNPGMSVRRKNFVIPAKAGTTSMGQASASGR
jgi:hypothetical protein